MRYYMRFLLVGAVSGFFCVLNYARNGAGRTLADIVMLFGFSAVKCQINFVMSAIYWYMPLFLFTAAAAINILSVLSSSDMGFLIVEGIVFFCIASFCVTAVVPASSWRCGCPSQSSWQPGSWSCCEDVIP